MEHTREIAALALEDGAIFYGRPFGALEALERGRRGEVVFATAMTGYQEICTDPSYRGQMVVLTYPLVGNYGIAPTDDESRRPWLSALLVREACDEYSNWRARESLDDYLARNDIPGVRELDTRALTRHLRQHGTLRGVLRVFPEDAKIDTDALIAEARAVQTVSQLDVVGQVSERVSRAWGVDGDDTAIHREGATMIRGATGVTRLAPTPACFESAQADFVAAGHSGATSVASHRASGEACLAPTGMPESRLALGNESRHSAPLLVGEGVGSEVSARILLIDTGFKHNIARCLAERGLHVTLAPHDVDLAFVRELDPDGVLLSNGPGDPENVAHLIEIVQWALAERTPLMGICLGHQVLGLAIGATTSRLPFGHHGSNHPVRERRTGRVTLTSQNHNFQVDADSIPAESGFYVSHLNLSDGSVEGLAHESLPIFSVQYHPEAAPGPEDNRYLFDRFANLATEHAWVAHGCLPELQQIAAAEVAEDAGLGRTEAALVG